MAWWPGRVGPGEEEEGAGASSGLDKVAGASDDASDDAGTGKVAGRGDGTGIDGDDAGGAGRTLRCRSEVSGPPSQVGPCHGTYTAEVVPLDFSARPVPAAKWDDLDPLEFERLRRLVGRSRGRADTALADCSDLDIARTLGLVRVDGREVCLLAGALRLFGREDALRRFVPTHEAALQIMRGRGEALEALPDHDLGM
jgi:hypothetical protein